MKQEAVGKPLDTQADTLINVLKTFQTVDPTFPIQYGICLIEIYQNEGLSLTTLAQKTNLTLSTVSRIVGALSSHRQQGQPYGLVTVKISPAERRRKELFLTTQGYELMETLCKTLS